MAGSLPLEREDQLASQEISMRRRSLSTKKLAAKFRAFLRADLRIRGRNGEEVKAERERAEGCLDFLSVLP